VGASNAPPMAGNSTKINAIIFYDFNCLEPLPDILACDLRFVTCHRETRDRSPAAANAKRPKR
jgi:hypothetical protein